MQKRNGRIRVSELTWESVALEKQANLCVEICPGRWLRAILISDR